MSGKRRVVFEECAVPLQRTMSLNSRSQSDNPLLKPERRSGGSGNHLDKLEKSTSSTKLRGSVYPSFRAFQDNGATPRSMLCPTIDRHVELPPPERSSLLRGLFELARCNPAPLNHGFIEPDILERTLRVVPASLLTVLALFVAYCAIFIFLVVPNEAHQTIEMGAVKEWTGGEISRVEVLLPIVSYLAFMASLALSRAYGVTLRHYETLHVMHPWLSRVLKKRTIVLSRDGVLRLEKVNNYGTFVSKKAVTALRNTSFAGRPDLVACDLYANYLCSMASFAASRHFMLPAKVLPFVAGVLLAFAPLIPRLVYGNSLWGDGRGENIVVVFLGPLVTLASVHGLCSMVAVHAETVMFHYERLLYLTLAMPDPGLDTKDWEQWPQMSFDSLLNVMTWHRLRWALSHSPSALSEWGKSVFQGLSALCLAYLIFSIAWVFAQGRHTVLLDEVFITGLALFVVFCPTLLYVLVILLRTNVLFKSHVLAICRVMLLSMRSDTSQTEGRAAYEAYDSEHTGKMREIRHVLRDLASALPLQTRYVTFFTFPVLPATYVVACMLAFVCCGLLMLRFFFGAVVPQ